MPKSDNPYPDWPGFDAPRYTPVPDDLFDLWLPHLSGAEVKVLLYICRRTFGFKKDADAISLAQITGGIIKGSVAKTFGTTISSLRLIHSTTTSCDPTWSESVFATEPYIALKGKARAAVEHGPFHSAWCRPAHRIINPVPAGWQQ